MGGHLQPVYAVAAAGQSNSVAQEIWEDEDSRSHSVLLSFGC